jgi:hypothetical protein
MIVPTRSKGMQPLTLCVKFASWNAERILIIPTQSVGMIKIRSMPE